MKIVIKDPEAFYYFVIASVIALVLFIILIIVVASKDTKIEVIKQGGFQYQNKVYYVMPAPEDVRLINKKFVKVAPIQNIPGK